MKTSSEMFSIYMFAKDPTMFVKSDKYTNGEFKTVKDLVDIEDNLLVSSQMANSLLLINQHEKIMTDSQQEPNSAPEPPASKMEEQVVANDE